MTDLFGKLNLKDQDTILVLDAPESFEPELAPLRDVTVLRTLPTGRAASFAIAFVTTLADVERISRTVAPRLEGDALLWCAYPKGSSRRYRCEFNRDTGWAALRAAGFETVRQVAIDEDWSALRFRRVAYIESLHRDPARATARGKARTPSPRSSRS